VSVAADKAGRWRGEGGAAHPVVSARWHRQVHHHGQERVWRRLGRLQRGRARQTVTADRHRRQGKSLTWLTSKGVVYAYTSLFATKGSSWKYKTEKSL